MNARLALIALPLVLAGCGAEPVATDADGREASGEVLEGSISDEMLPLEDLRSQAPLADPEAANEGSDDDDGEERRPAGDQAPDEATPSIAPNAEAGLEMEAAADAPSDVPAE